MSRMTGVTCVHGIPSDMCSIPCILDQVSFELPGILGCSKVTGSTEGAPLVKLVWCQDTKVLRPECHYERLRCQPSGVSVQEAAAAAATQQWLAQLASQTSPFWALIFGTPTVGKTTQAQLMARRYSVTACTLDQLLRVRMLLHFNICLYHRQGQGFIQ